MQPDIFCWEDRLAKLEKLGNPVPRLDSIVDWRAFRPLLKVIHQKQRKSNAGRKPHAMMLILKMRALQTLYNLSNEQTEFQMRHRLSFQRFLGLSPEDAVPDASVHNSQVLDDLRDEENSGHSLWLKPDPNDKRAQDVWKVPR